MLWCDRRYKNDWFSISPITKKGAALAAPFACHQNSVKYSDPSFPLESTV